MKNRLYFWFILILSILLVVGIFLMKSEPEKTRQSVPTEFDDQNQSADLYQNTGGKKEQQKNIEIKYVGPRENVPSDAPVAYGFWSFAYPVPGVISRSGQPLIEEFRWLREKGWKSVVNFRIEGDHAPEISDDEELPGFKALGFNYLRIGLNDGSAPTDEQAKNFLAFVTSKENQPVHIHCRGGYGRAGVMMALYRYSVQGWPVEDAINESRLFKGGISEGQKKWLSSWAEKNPPGYYSIK